MNICSFVALLHCLFYVVYVNLDVTHYLYLMLFSACSYCNSEFISFSLQ